MKCRRFNPGTIRAVAVLTVVFLITGLPLYAEEYPFVGFTSEAKYGCVDLDGASFVARLRRNGSAKIIDHGRLLKTVTRKIDRYSAKLVKLESRQKRSESRIQKIGRKLEDLIGFRDDIDNCLLGTFFTTDIDNLGNNQGADELPCSVAGNKAAADQLKTAAIMQGQSCQVGNSPIVQLYLYTSSGHLTASCSGTVISANTILSAAHCFEHDIGSALIRTGKGDFWSKGIYVHPDYRKLGLPFESHDLALVTVAGTLPTQTVGLLTNQSFTTSEPLIIAGYGLDENQESGVLKAGAMTLRSADPESISAYYGGNLSNTCSGDSGGPLLVKRSGTWLLAGVVSNGIREDCGPGDISFFANVTHSQNQAFLRGVLGNY